jgi:hypothetical protein
MFKLELHYSNDTTETKYFATWAEADWAAHMAGDHVLDYTIVREPT